MVTGAEDVVLYADEQGHDVSLCKLFRTAVAWLQRKGKEKQCSFEESVAQSKKTASRLKAKK